MALNKSPFKTAPTRVGGILAAALLAASLASAQGYLSGSALNKKIVTDFYRLVFEPRNADLIDQYIAPDFVDHNPRLENGREGLAKLLRTLPPPASTDINETMQRPPALVIAENDLVTFIFKEDLSDPNDKTKKYEHFAFDTFRIKNGKIVEHWDGATK